MCEQYFPIGNGDCHLNPDHKNLPERECWMCLAKRGSLATRSSSWRSASLKACEGAWAMMICQGPTTVFADFMIHHPPARLLTRRG